MVTLGGKRKVAQYCQWDGYPTGQGKTVAEFIAGKMDLPLFKEKVAALRKATGKHVEKLWKECGAEGDFVNMETSARFEEKHPEFHRNTGAKVLEMIQDGKVSKVRLDEDFLKDGLFCEWAYELDLDREELVIYSSRCVNEGAKIGNREYETAPVKTIPFDQVEEEFGDIMARYEAWSRSDQDEDFSI